MISVAAELDKARKKLLDLTMRNRLLNYRPSKVRSVRILGELPSEIYDALVLRGKTLEVRGTGPKTSQATNELLSLGDNVTATPAMRAEEWHARTDEELEAQHTDRYLQTP